MNKKLLEIVENHEEALALYTYMNAPDHTIPVLIAENVSEWLMNDLHDLNIHNSIFLTIEDLMRGGDVFGVVLLHILARSECVYGENILKDTKYDHSQIRTSLEAHLRHFLIDLREQRVAWTDSLMMKNKLLIICDRIWCGLHRYLNGKKILAFGDIGIFLSDLDHDWSCDLSWLRTMIHKNEIDLSTVHDTLLGLLHKIDTMSENWIK